MRSRERVVTLSSYQARALLKARTDGLRHCTSSADLNYSRAKVELIDEGVRFSNGFFIDWKAIDEIKDAGRKCFEFSDEGVWEIMIFSDTTRWLRQLAATEGAPTMLVSGKPMHRIKNIDPIEDTRRKIASVSPIRGRVLDTATGLGYTAIEAAKSAKGVVTVELDPASIEIAKHNPWSKALFENERIKIVIGSAFDLIDGFRDGEFDLVIHDPPTMSLAGELYSLEFYTKAVRVLSRRGKMFHYTGDPESGLGASTTRGVIRRMHEAGFRKVIRHPEAFGVVGYKGEAERGSRERRLRGDIVRTIRERNPSKIRNTYVRYSGDAARGRTARTSLSK